MQIAKTALTKAAFHHGSTVPYGIGASAINPTSVVNISLLATDYADEDRFTLRLRQSLPSQPRRRVPRVS